MVLYKDKDSEIYKIAGASAADVAGLPIGTIIAYYSDKVPDDFLLCDGSEYDIAKYPKLYQLLETNVLPDLRNRTLFGKDAETLGDTTDGKLPNITGTTGNPIFDGSRSAFANWGGTIAGAFTRTAKISNTDWYVSSLGSNSNGRYNLQFDASRVSDIYQDTDKVVPSSVYINYIIKALDNSATIDYDTSQTEAIIHAAVQQSREIENFSMSYGALQVVNKSIAIIYSSEARIPVAVPAAAWTTLVTLPTAFTDKYNPVVKPYTGGCFDNNSASYAYIRIQDGNKLQVYTPAAKSTAVGLYFNMTFAVEEK